MTYWINSAAETHLKGYETLRLVAYDDKQPKKVLKAGDAILGTLTNGWGHTGPDVFIGQTITKEQAQAWFVADVTEVTDALIKNLPHDVWDALNDYEKGGLVSFFFNVGVGYMTSANPLKRPASFFTQLVNGDLDAPIKGFPQFTLSGGVSMKGLRNRRASEVALFTTVDGRSSTPAGNVIGEPEPKSLVVKVKEFAGGGLVAAGGAGQTIIDTVAQVQPIGESFPWLKVVFGVAIAIGFALLIYSKIEDRSKSGA